MFQKFSKKNFAIKPNFPSKKAFNSPILLQTFVTGKVKNFNAKPKENIKKFGKFIK
jgi:hypothetical protein